MNDFVVVVVDVRFIFFVVFFLIFEINDFVVFLL